MNHGTLNRVDRMMADYVEQGRTAGMVTLVSQGGEIIHRGSRGFRDIGPQAPMAEDTIFRIYSMTKPIVSAALMQFYERGQFDLDDPAWRWIPALKTLKVYRDADTREALESDITLRQLLSHTSGLSYGFDTENEPVDRLYGPVWDAILADLPMPTVLERVFELPLIAQPGRRWHYSIATDVCGHLVELFADMPLGDYLQQAIFEPLGMTDTGFGVAAGQHHRIARLYGRGENDALVALDTGSSRLYLPAANPGPVRCHSGGGGLLSTIADYWRFAQAMLDRGEFDGVRILKPATVALMTTNQVPAELQPLSFNGIFPGPVAGYGFGLGYCISLMDDEQGSAGDFGWGGMADTYCWIDPKRQLVGILMQQFLPSLTYHGRLDFRRAVYRELG